MPSKPSQKITPRLIIHGGAGNILPSNLSPSKYKAFHTSLLTILSDTHHYLLSHSALDTVVFAVIHLENNPLFNSGHGAVFTREGINELEASVMVSEGRKKRGVGVMGLRRVKNPIKLAREMLVRGDRDLEGGNAEGRGAQAHCQIEGEAAEKLAKEWGVELADPSYFFLQSRWDEHIAGLEREKSNVGIATWDKQAFVPQGTCGAVALDSNGVCACATSTGGMTNKLTGRIGDTPTLGAGFWAEKWDELYTNKSMRGSPILKLSDSLRGLVADCIPSLSMYMPISGNKKRIWRATAMSGTGNGDSFLRTNAVRTTSAIARYQPKTSLKSAMKQITGPGGELQKSAGDRWKKTGEGEGGIIGIEVTVEEDEEGVVGVKSGIVEDFNCGGMWRALVDDEGKAVCRVWRKGEVDKLGEYKGEGMKYDLGRWRNEKSGK